MGSIYKLLALPYAQVKNVAVDAVWGLIMATVTASGIPGGGRSCSFGGYNWKDYAEIHKVSGFRA